MTIRVEDLKICATASGLPIVEGVSFTIGPGEVLGLVGESGSGKTTISHAMLGYARRGTHIAGGSVEIAGTDILAQPAAAQLELRGRLVSYVPQDPSAALNPALTIGTQLTERLTMGTDALPLAEAQARIAGILSQVRLPSDPAFLKMYPSQISGGQQQRVGIAMAIASHPRLIVLDEPTTGLDVATQREVLQLVGEICSEKGIAAIYISHDLAVISHVAHKVMVLYAGRVVEEAASRDFFARPAHPYAQALLQSLPDHTEKRQLMSIAGHPPALAARQEGCVFKARCQHAQSLCDRAPLLRGHGEGRVACHLPQDGPAHHSPASLAPRPTGTNPPFLVMNNLSARYGSRTVLHDISLQLGRGECLSIVGESGSGKSTLSRCLIGLHETWSGEIRLGGAELSPKLTARQPGLQRRLQFIFQNPYGSLNPRRTIGENIAGPLRHFEPGLSAAQVDERVKAILLRVNLTPDHAGRYPNQLSGGEKQRAAIARALICAPEVIICDEITSALDVSVQASIIELLRSLMDDGLSLIFVTHNLGVVRSLSDRIAVLDKGYIVEEGLCGEVMDDPKAPYTRALMANTLSVA